MSRYSHHDSYDPRRRSDQYHRSYEQPTPYDRSYDRYEDRGTTYSGRHVTDERYCTPHRSYNDRYSDDRAYDRDQYTHSHDDRYSRPQGSPPSTYDRQHSEQSYNDRDRHVTPHITKYTELTHSTDSKSTGHKHESHRTPSASPPAQSHTRSTDTPKPAYKTNIPQPIRPANYASLTPLQRQQWDTQQQIHINNAKLQYTQHKIVLAEQQLKSDAIDEQVCDAQIQHFERVSNKSFAELLNSKVTVK